MCSEGKKSCIFIWGALAIVAILYKPIFIAINAFWNLNSTVCCKDPAATSLFWKIVDVIRQNNIPVEKSSGLSIEAMGQLGDSFGAINWIVSAVALFFVALTYKTQKEELKEAKEESELNRFDRIYQSHRELVASIEHKKGEIFRGAAALNHEYERLLRYALPQNRKQKNETNHDVIRRVRCPIQAVAITSKITLGEANQAEEERQINEAKALIIAQNLVQSKSMPNEIWDAYYEEAQYRIAPYFSGLEYTLDAANKIAQKVEAQRCKDIIYNQLSPQEFVLVFYFVLAGNKAKHPNLLDIARDSELQSRFKGSLLHPNHTNLL